MSSSSGRRQGSPSRPRRCVAGFDDGRFSKSWRCTLGVLSLHCWAGPHLCPCGAVVTRLTVDGMDSTERIIEAVERARGLGYGVEALLLDTNVFAGFNVADPEAVASRLGLPVLVVYWYPPRREAVERALRLHFPDWRERLRLLEEAWSRLRQAPCPRGGLLLAVYGADWGWGHRLLCGLQLYTRAPEPLYTAHTLASELSEALLRRGAVPECIG